MSSVSAFTVWGVQFIAPLWKRSSISQCEHGAASTAEAAHIRSPDSTVQHLVGNARERETQAQQQLRRVCDASTLLTAALPDPGEFQTLGRAAPAGFGRGEQSSLVELGCVGAGLATRAGASGGQRGFVSSGTSSEREAEGSLPVSQHEACLDNRQLSAWLSALELLDFSNSSPWTSERALSAIPWGTVAFSLMQKPGHEFETTSALWIFFPMM